MIVRSLLFLILILAPRAASAGPKTLEFPGQVKHRTLQPEEAKKLAREPRTLSLQLRQTKVTSERILVEAILTHRSRQPLTLVVWPYGGAFPYGGDNPLLLGFSKAALKQVKYVGKLYPPEPPLPMAIELPAECQVRFQATIDLRNFAWGGAPEVELDWSFHYFQGSSPRGTTKVRLPARPPR